MTDLLTTTSSHITNFAVAPVKIGNRVTRISFTDCFGTDHPAVSGLVVESVRLIRNTDIPDYWRIAAAGATGRYEGAFDRFFVMEA